MCQVLGRVDPTLQPEDGLVPLQLPSSFVLFESVCLCASGAQYNVFLIAVLPYKCILHWQAH